MKVFIFALIVLSLAFQSQRVNAQKSNKDVVGIWKYEAPNAPEGFTEGSFVISEKDGALAGILQLLNGQEMEIGSVVYRQDSLLVTMLVDYSTVSINSIIEGNSFTGTVSTNDGTFTITGKKNETE